MMSSMQSKLLNPLVLMIVAIASFTTCALSQSGNDDQVSVSVELSRSSVYVGDEVSYKVIVRGARDPQTPVIKFPEIVRAQFLGPSSQSYTSVQIINGVRRSVTERSYIFQYTLTALSEGSVSIPAPTVMINGQAYTGQTAQFESLLPVISDADDLELSIDRTQLYLNESVRVECVWWIADNTSEFNLTSSNIPDTFEVRPAQPTTGGQYKIDFALDGQSMTGYVETGMHNGREMSRLSFAFTVTPTQTGRFELGPMRSIFTRHSGTGSRFRAYTESDSIPVEVIEVPKSGQPDNYKGAIGQYQLIARASNTNVNVGDPIDLTLRIRGEEPMVGIEDAPDLTLIQSFYDQFKIDSEGWREITPRNAGTRLYQITVRALDEHVDEIPSIDLPSFIPETGRYTVFKSDPIPLRVTGVREVTLADALVNSNQNNTNSKPAERIDRIDLTPAAPGLWAHTSADEMRAQRSFSLAQTLQNPTWQATIVAPPALFCCVWAFASYTRTRNPNRVRLMRAFSIAKRKSGVDSLKAYIAHALEIDLDAVTASDAKQLPIDEQTQDRLYHIILSDESNTNATDDQRAIAKLLSDAHTQCLSRLKGAAA